MRYSPTVRWCTLLAVPLLLAGCARMPTLPALTPYRMDIQQGNVVTQDMVAKLKPGMTRQQVRFVLGTPLVVDPFRTDRWDYVYRFEKAGRPAEHRHITVIFKDDQLVRLEGDVVPAGAPGGVTLAPAPQRAAAAPAAGAAREDSAKAPDTRKAQPEEPPEERGFFGRILERLGF